MFTIFNKARSLHINNGDSCKAAADFNGLFRKISQPKNCCTFTEQVQKVCGDTYQLLWKAVADCCKLPESLSYATEGSIYIYTMTTIISGLNEFFFYVWLYVQECKETWRLLVTVSYTTNGRTIVYPNKRKKCILKVKCIICSMLKQILISQPNLNRL